MALLTDREIMQAIERGDVSIQPLGERQLQPASYDLSLGDKGRG